MKSTRGTTAEG